MRYLGMTFAALALFALSFVTAGPPPGVSHTVAVSYGLDLPDPLAITTEATDAIVAAVEAGVPKDSHRAAYVAANRPLAAWRTSVEGYRHIDPHIG